MVLIMVVPQYLTSAQERKKEIEKLEAEEDMNGRSG